MVFDVIETQHSLKIFTQKLKSESMLENKFIVGIDTEFASYNCYYPKLCLLQISTSKHCYLIDAIKIADLSILFEILYTHKVLWVTHAANQDIAILERLSKRFPKHVFDTQIATSLLGYGIQVSYKTLVQKLFAKCIDKTYTRFDWQIRPLPIAAKHYAFTDVSYLLEMYNVLSAKLVQEKKSAWFDEEIYAMMKKIANPILPEMRWQYLTNIHTLSKSYYLAAFYLAAWRELEARRRNIPRKWFIKDSNLLAYACGKAKLSHAKENAFEEFKKTYQFKLQNSLTLNVVKLNQDEKNQYMKLKNLIHKTASRYQISTNVLATRQSMIAFIKGNETNLLQGWRGKILFEPLEEIGWCMK